MIDWLVFTICYSYISIPTASSDEFAIILLLLFFIYLLIFSFSHFLHIAYAIYAERFNTYLQENPDLPITVNAINVLVEVISKSKGAFPLFHRVKKRKWKKRKKKNDLRMMKHVWFFFFFFFLSHLTFYLSYSIYPFDWYTQCMYICIYIYIATTMMELRSELKAVIDLLVKSASYTLSLSSGCELFMHFVTRTSFDTNVSTHINTLLFFGGRTPPPPLSLSPQKRIFIQFK